MRINIDIDTINLTDKELAFEARTLRSIADSIDPKPAPKVEKSTFDVVEGKWRTEGKPVEATITHVQEEPKPTLEERLTNLEGRVEEMDETTASSFGLMSERVSSVDSATKGQAKRVKALEEVVAGLVMQMQALEEGTVLARIGKLEDIADRGGGARAGLLVRSRGQAGEG